MPDKVVVGNRLKAYRRAKGVSRDMAAAEIGISSSALGMYEQGSRTPRDEIKIKIASYYGNNVQEIFFFLKLYYNFYTLIKERCIVLPYF